MVHVSRLELLIKGHTPVNSIDSSKIIRIISIRVPAPAGGGYCLQHPLLLLDSYHKT